MTKAIHAVVNKMDQFDGKDVTKYLREYVKEMELHRVTEGEMIQSFELVVAPEIREHVRAIKDGHGRNWEELKLALKEEYFMEDSETVTKRTFFQGKYRYNHFPLLPLKYKNKRLSFSPLRNLKMFCNCQDKYPNTTQVLDNVMNIPQASYCIKILLIGFPYFPNRSK